VSVTSPAPLEVIIKKEQELGSPSRKKNSDQFYLEEHSKVSQARSKEMSTGKEQMDLPRSFASKIDWPTTTFAVEKTCGAPTVQAPTTKLLPSTFMSSNPAPIILSTNGGNHQVTSTCFKHHWMAPVHASLSLS